MLNQNISYNSFNLEFSSSIRFQTDSSTLGLKTSFHLCEIFFRRCRHELTDFVVSDNSNRSSLDLAPFQTLSLRNQMNNDATTTTTTTTETQNRESSGTKAKDFELLTKKYAESCSKILGRLNGPYEELRADLARILPPESVEMFDSFIREGKAQYRKDLLNVAANISEGLSGRLNMLDDMIDEAKGHERVKAQLIPTPAQVSRGVLYKEKIEQFKLLEQIYLEETKKGHGLMDQIITLKQENDLKAEVIKSVASKFEQNAKTAQEINADFADLTRNKD